MGFFEGFRAAIDGKEDMELFERAYQDFALSQPAGIAVTFFDGYRSYHVVDAAHAKEMGNGDGYMFNKFSGNELGWKYKLKLISRAIHNIEKQQGARQRAEGSPLLLKYFEWDEKAEAEAHMIERLHIKSLYMQHEQVKEMVDEMGIEILGDQECHDWILKVFTGIGKPELMEWLAAGQEHLIVQFMDLKPDNLTPEQYERYRKSCLDENLAGKDIASMEEFKKIVADTQLRLAFMAF